jgi:hypothetical protein
MSARTTNGATNLPLGRDHYLSLGPLTPSDMEYLAKFSDRPVRLRVTLANWYGHHGAYVALQEYRRLLRQQAANKSLTQPH